jgi:hypothetical protein
MTEPSWRPDPQSLDAPVLNPGQKALALRLRQTQIRKVNKITGAVDLHHINAAWPTFHSGLHQTQNPPQPVKYQAGHTLLRTTPQCFDGPIPHKCSVHSNR